MRFFADPLNNRVRVRINARTERKLEFGVDDFNIFARNDVANSIQVDSGNYRRFGL